MNILAIIPARAGSRGVPDKNILPLLEKPVISYTIEAAQAARLVDRIVVTTDEPRIRPTCEEYGITQIERPADLAENTARIDDVMRHACTVMRRQFQYHPDLVVLLYANVPVRAKGIIDKAVKQLIKTGADSVQTLAPVGKFHPFWLYQLDGDQASKYIDNKIHRRQELPPLYAIDSSVAVVTYTSLMDAQGNDDPHAFWGRDRRAVVQQAHETVDIDNLRDFFLAEAVLRENMMAPTAQ